MTGFSVDWLSLREPYDTAARDRGLMDRLAAAVADRDGPIVDLGCGTGSTTRALAPILGNKRPWLLVDHDATLLAETAGRIDPTLACDTLALDLATDLDRVPFARAAAITCSALIDLVSASWMADLTDRLIAHKVPFYAALTYDGRIDWDPPITDDDLVTDGFNRDMVTDKGFGPALGPLAARRAVETLAAHRFTVAEADTPWRMAPEDRDIQRALADGFARAAAKSEPASAARIGAWEKARTETVAAGTSRLSVGHTDILAIPPKAT